MALLDGVHHHWRDPMQLFFVVIGAVGRSVVLFMRCAGVAFVCLGMSLIFVVGALFAYAIVPIMAETSLQLAMHALATVWLLFNIYFNYAMCIATDPGTVHVAPRQKVFSGDDAASDSNDDDESDSQQQQWDADSDASLLPRARRSGAPTLLASNGSSSSATDTATPRLQIFTNPAPSRSISMTFCRTCRIFRPVRAHHCGVCDKCIDHMDHHCPWVNNCIGRDNYRYFVSFLLWLVVGCCYAAVMAYPAAYGELSPAQFDKLVNLFSVAMLQRTRVAPAKFLQFAFCIAVSAGIAVAILGGWHLYLIATAQTSVEYQINRSSRNRRRNGGKVVSPYSAGSVHANWELVFGRCEFKLLSLLPSTARAPQPESITGSADKTEWLMYDSQNDAAASSANSPDAVV